MVALALSLLSLWLGSPQGAAASGTYFVLMCPAACSRSDSAHAVALGILVLDTVRTPAHLPLQGPPNGCFDFRRRPTLESYAVLYTDGYTTWDTAASGDSIMFLTYRSPDAGHEVRAQLTDSGFVGLGHSWGAGSAYISAPDEFVIGYRLGPPDMRRCSIVRTDRRDRWLSPILFGALSLGVLLLLRPHAW